MARAGETRHLRVNAVAWLAQLIFKHNERNAPTGRTNVQLQTNPQLLTEAPERWLGLLVALGIGGFEDPRP